MVEIGNKRSTMLKSPLVCIHPCESMGVKPRGLTQEFYEMCKTKLNPGGILVTQAKGVFRPTDDDRMMLEKGIRIKFLT